MLSMKQKIFLWIAIAVLSIFGISIYNEFMANHTYYFSMFWAWENRKIIIRAVIAAAIPLSYIIRNKKFSLKTFAMRILPTSLVFFGVAHILIKESIFWTIGFITLLINTAIIYFLGMYFILWMLSLGTLISKKRIKFSQNRMQEMFLNFGIWLGVFLLLIKVLMIFDIFYAAIIWLIFIGFWVAIYYAKNSLKTYKEQTEEAIWEYKEHNLKNNPIKRVGIILIAFSIIYYLYGFQLSFIPYSTAWDANHEYMYIPKVIAENHWILRGNMGPAATPVYLWHGFVSFRFGLVWGIKKFRIWPDTIAVAMNFLSWIFVLFLGLGSIKEILQFFSKKTDEEKTEAWDISKETKKEIIFYSGRLLLLLWLTSGMWAFLVFVDNKTDLGVAAITILAILSWFIFLNHIKNHKEEKTSKESMLYIIISWFFFALASMAKPTAFLDIAIFILLIIWFRINNILAIWLWVMIVWVTGALKVGNAADLLTTTAGKYLIIIWIIIAAIGIIQTFIKNPKKIRTEKKKYINYILIRWAGLIWTLIIFKWSHLIYTQIKEWNFGISNFSKALLLSKEQKTLLVAKNIEAIQQQNQVDTEYQNNQTTSLAACKTTTYTKEELAKNLKDATLWNVDVGRYVWYWRKEIAKTNWLNLWYWLLRIFYPKDNTCYGLNKWAKLLCKNSTAVDNFNVAILEQLLPEMRVNSQAYDILSWALQKFYQKWLTSKSQYNPLEFRDQTVSLRQFYQSHVVKTEKWKIFIAYRYLIPLNITFNRSLQNLSSYYTDIGFIWIFTYVFIIAGFIYVIIKKEKELIAMYAATIIGWAIWWMIWGGILWYWLGLVMRTILSSILFIKHMLDDSNDEWSKTMFYIMLFLIAIRGILQMFFNLIRISSQWAWGPFSWYKMNIGKTMEIDDTLQQKEALKNWYRWKDVFDLQFPSYNKFLEYVKDRPNNDWVLIAWTYMQYFLKNQRNIKWDWMLTRFRNQTSDNNDCKSYQRLKNNNIKYFVIDPNIWTVWMWEWNESLFNTFFAKKDPVTGKIQEHGAISMFVKLAQDWYISLYNTNNLWAKYAFLLDDQSIKSFFGANLTADELLLLRAKLSIARYFPDVNEMVNWIWKIFNQRMASWDAIWDIADVYWKIIDEAKLKTIVTKLSNNWTLTAEAIKKEVTPLTQDERLILAQYLGINNLYKAANPQYQEVVNGIMTQSLASSSQVMIFKLAD